MVTFAEDLRSLMSLNMLNTGSQRISLEEHYFRTFADINGDGFLEKWEYDLSLYNADSWNGPKRTQNAWEYHDIDADGRVEFMERKRVSGDVNGDNALSHEEWVAADYPEDYGPFQLSANPSGVVGVDEYKNYLLYHHCSGSARRPYSTGGMSPYSWDASCMLNFIVREDSPFVYNDTRGNLRGLPLAVLKQVASRLGWNHSVSPVTYEVYANKTNPVAITDSVVNDFQLNMLDATGRSLRLAVLSQYTEVPREWICSRSIWPEDGFVVVVRSEIYEPPFTNMIIFLVISPHFINFFCTLFFTVLIVGHIVWILERWGTPTSFHPDYGSGVMDGLWWAVVTQSTVGYGDKVPRSNLGRVFGIFWILYGLIVFGVFSSTVTGFLDEAKAANSISGNHSITARTYPNTAILCCRTSTLRSIYFACLPFSVEFMYADRLIDVLVEKRTSPRKNFVSRYTACNPAPLTLGEPKIPTQMYLRLTGSKLEL